MPMTIPYVSQRTYRRTEEQIGEGSSSKVYRGQCITTLQHPTCALKIQQITPVAIKVFNDLDAARYEGALLKTLTDHNLPHTIRYRWFQKNEKPELVLDFIPAPNLYEYSDNLSWGDITTITEQLIEVLTLLDKCSYIHGDLKPANLLYEKNSRYITVIDWALACKSSSSPVLESNLPYSTIQTYTIRAPEIFLGLGHTTRADVWSLGVVIYQLVTKQYLAALKECEDETSVDNVKRRKQSLQNLFSRIGLPNADAVEKIKDRPYCPWITIKGRVSWKEPFEAEPLPPWKFRFKSSAAAMKASTQDIGLYVSMLDKIFRLADRASIQEIQEEFKNGRQEELKFLITGFGPNQVLKICSGDVTVIFDSRLDIYRSCIHVPQNPAGKYLLTLEENGLTIVNNLPMYTLEHTKLEIHIPKVIERAST